MNKSRYFTNGYDDGLKEFILLREYSRFVD